MNSQRLFNLFRWLTMANFAAFTIGAFVFGGVAIDAINGHSGNGHYYLCFYGRCHETSHAIFVYSLVHGVSVMVSFFSFLIVGFANWLQKISS